MSLAQMRDAGNKIVGNHLLSLGSKIVAIGRNYGKHAAELNNPIPTKPVLFLKPRSSYLRPGGTIVVPDDMDSVHHEVELGVVIGKSAHKVTTEAAMDHVAGYVVALDITAREAQSEAKAAGLPWATAKGYDTFCPVSDFVHKKRVEDPHALTLWCAVNGQERQRGTTADMIFSIPTLIAHVSSIMTLEEGDLLLTGTPEGVGPLVPGDTVTIGVDGLWDGVEFTVGRDGAEGSS